jgi:hypothetical protein
VDEIELKWITRVETPCAIVLYLSGERGQLLLTDRPLDRGGAPLAAVDLTNPLSAELPELVEMTKWYLAEKIDAGHQSFAPAFDFGHPAVDAILVGKHPMVGVALVGSSEDLLPAADLEAGRATAIAAGGGVELLPISTDLGPLVDGRPRSHLVLVLASREPSRDVQ